METGRRCGGKDSITQNRLRGNLQVKVAGAKIHSPETIAHKDITGIDGAMLGVVLEIPPQVSPEPNVLHPEARNNRRRVARLSKKRDSSEFHRGGKNVRLPRYQGPAEVRIKEILLRDFPGKNLTRLGYGRT